MLRTAARLRRNSRISLPFGLGTIVANTSLPEVLNQLVGGQPYVSTALHVAYGIRGAASRLAQLCADACRTAARRFGVIDRHQSVQPVPVVRSEERRVGKGVDLGVRI